MADIGYVKALLTGIQDEKTKRILMQVFEHVLPSMAFGEPDPQTRATNLNAYWQASTTASVAGTEFSIVHGMGRTPHVAIPVLDVTARGSQLVPLTVSRAADGQRVYFTSSSTSAPVMVLLE